MKLKQLATVAALAVTGSAFAANADLGVLTGATTDKSFGDFFSTAEGVFSDTFTFSLLSTQTVNGSTAASGIGNYFVVLLQGTNTVATDATPASFSFAGLSAGSYILQIVGTNAGANSFYGGSVSAVTAVPEPESYAMMLAGLGAIGFIAGRRRMKG